MSFHFYEQQNRLNFEWRIEFFHLDSCSLRHVPSQSLILASSFSHQVYVLGQHLNPISQHPISSLQHHQSLLFTLTRTLSLAD